jgi:hypothetical protein
VPEHQREGPRPPRRRLCAASAPVRPEPRDRHEGDERRHGPQQEQQRYAQRPRWNVGRDLQAVTEDQPERQVFGDVGAATAEEPHPQRARHGQPKDDVGSEDRNRRDRGAVPDEDGGRDSDQDRRGQPARQCRRAQRHWHVRLSDVTRASPDGRTWNSRSRPPPNDWTRVYRELEASAATSVWNRTSRPGPCRSRRPWRPGCETRARGRGRHPPERRSAAGNTTRARAQQEGGRLVEERAVLEVDGSTVEQAGPAGDRSDGAVGVGVGEDPCIGTYVPASQYIRYEPSRRNDSSASRRPPTPSGRASRRRFRAYLLVMVGARGFEPPTSSSRTMRATRLRHAPTEVPRSTGPADHSRGGSAGRLDAPPGGRPPARTGTTASAAATNVAAITQNTMTKPRPAPIASIVTP